jgi:uncharacterized protein YjiS (DUF1127 family)
MAVINNFENVSPVAILASRIAERVQDAANQYKAWKAEKATRAALMRLTDAELADIGLARFQIRTLDLSSDV